MAVRCRDGGECDGCGRCVDSGEEEAPRNLTLPEMRRIMKAVGTMEKLREQRQPKGE